MEKLENHIKEKLEERQIAPSANAWEKISGQLTEVEKPKRKTWYLYAVAASVIGILVVSLLFNDGKKPIEDNVQIVEESIREQETNQDKEKGDSIESVEIEALVLEEVNPEKTEAKEAENTVLKAPSEEIAVVSEKAKQRLEDSFLKDSSLIHQKANEVLAQVTLLETTNTNVSDVEVDSLLRAAQREILTEQLIGSDGAVDAMALLTEVEDELDESFRNQIFEALKDGYVKLRTAVADRNN